MGRRAKLIFLGVILIIAGMIIPSLYYSAHYNLFTGEVTSYDVPLLPYGFSVAVLGVIVVVIGLIVKDETRAQGCLPRRLSRLRMKFQSSGN